MTKLLAGKSHRWLYTALVIGLVFFITMPPADAEDREKDEIIDLLGTETEPAESLLPPGVSVQSEFFPGEGPPIGMVQLREGDPLVIHSGQSVAYPLKKDHSVFTGDTIITEQNARLNLLMIDKSVLAIAPYSKLVLDETAFDPNTQTRSSTLRLLFGRIRSIVAKIEGKPNYWVQTPTAVAGVRGSDFGVASANLTSAVVTTEATEIEWDGAAVAPCMVAGGAGGVDLASGSADHSVRLWNSTTGAEIAELSGHSGPVTTVAFSPDGTILATGSTDQSIRLWDVTTGEELAVLEGYDGTISSIAFSPDGTRLASGSSDNLVRVWSVPSGRQLGLFAGHSGPVSSVAFSPDGTSIASASADGTVRIWSPETGRQTALFKGHADSVLAVAFSPDGTTVASGAADHTVRLWEFATGRQLASLEAGPGAVYSVAFSSDGAQVIAGSADNLVRVWDVRELGQPVWLESQSDHAYSVAVSSNNAMVASGSEDQSIHLWDLKSGRALGELQGHDQSVLAVAFRSGVVAEKAAGVYGVPCATAAALVESIGPNLSAAAILGMPPRLD
jgi:hypothetical protein